MLIDNKNVYKIIKMLYCLTFYMKTRDTVYCSSHFTKIVL